MLSTDTIAATEDLLGIRYTEAERAAMSSNLEGQIEAARRRRGLPLPHDLAPATRFDPRLPGFRMPVQAAASGAASMPAPGPVPDALRTYASRR